MNKRYLLLITTAILLTTLACTGLDTLLPDVRLSDNTDRPASSETLKLADNFSQKGSGWEVGSYDGGEVGYFEGKYRVTSTGDGIIMWGAAGRSLEDVVIDVDAEQISAPSNNNNDYGVICRLQQNGEGYYGLISGDGFYAIMREDGDGHKVLVDWTESSIIRQGNAQNHIQLGCEGSKIILIVNGQLLAETSDTKYPSGDIGLTTTSYEVEETEIHFDNLTVR